jgi:hypothetical protein
MAGGVNPKRPDAVSPLTRGALVTEPKIAVYSPRCPHCGRKMVLARIEPGGEAEQPADHYTYTCPQGHELTKRVERKE